MTKLERNAKIMAQLDLVTKRGLKSKAAARNLLVKEGIYTPKGNLKAEFGGRGKAKLAKTA